MQELLGAPVAKHICAELAERVEGLKSKGLVPKLAIVRIGENAGDLAYERGALSRMAKVGVDTEVHALSLDVVQEELETTLANLSADRSVHGILMMRPLPRGLYEAKATACVVASKDLDGMTTPSLAKVFSGEGEGFAPCTAEAVMAILDYYGYELEGKRVAVLGRSLVIGKPVAQLLLAKNATVTLCHSKTADLAHVCQESELVVSCMGRAHSLGADMFADDAIIVDVSTNDDGAGGITGDFDATTISETSHISYTPVPRGVGSVTTSILARHVVESAECSINWA